MTAAFAVPRRVVLGNWPTPVVAAPAAARACGAAAFFVKRDDLGSPLYGGTKVRALEYFLGAARDAGARETATLGPAGSHHVLATALFARRAGFGVRAALFPQPPTIETAELPAVLDALGVASFRAPHAALLWWAAARARFGRGPAGRRPFWIPAGGASALGALGAVRGGLELAADVRAGKLPPPDRVVVAAGSCGAAAGLLVGCALGGLATEIAAVRVTPRIVASHGRILALARGAARAAKAARAAGDDGFAAASFPKSTEDAAALAERLRLDHAHYGPGYATPGRDAAALLALAAEDGLALEGTYTAKAFGAALGPASRGKTIVFWNTFAGVTPAEAWRRFVALEGKERADGAATSPTTDSVGP